MSSQIDSFKPQLGNHPKVLILGSIPGVKSLEMQAYYAHPRNSFWSIIGDFLGVPLTSEDWSTRYQCLKDHHIALWDVIQQCERPGSLDSAIRSDSLVANDIDGLLRAHASIRKVLCNGATAWRLFHKHFPQHAGLVEKMPSTSPAYASLSVANKAAIWHAALTLILAPQADQPS